MGYRPKTNDYVIAGKVYDLFDVTKRKKDLEKIKQKAKQKYKYKYVRVLKRNKEYQVWVR